MKIIRFLFNGNRYWGKYDAAADEIYTSFKETENLSAFRSVIDFFDRAERDNCVYTDAVSYTDAKLLAPVLPTKNVLCIGKNYYDHILEFDGSAKDADNVKENPIFFSKAISSITGPFSPILLHPGVTDSVDYEAELAVVIGKRGINIPREKALEHVYAYTALNDVTARDLQKIHQQWLRGKSLDSHCPVGPWLVTADEIPDPQDLKIRSTVNGEIRQDSNTRLMIHDVPALIEVLSRGMTLLPGDVIASGTPKGVGMGFTPPKFLNKGDTVEIYVEKIGSLINPVE